MPRERGERGEEREIDRKRQNLVVGCLLLHGLPHTHIE